VTYGSWKSMELPWIHYKTVIPLLSTVVLRGFLDGGEIFMIPTQPLQVSYLCIITKDRAFTTIN